jgi:hypothetical protein
VNRKVVVFNHPWQPAIARSRFGRIKKFLIDPAFQPVIRFAEQMRVPRQIPRPLGRATEVKSMKKSLLSSALAVSVLGLVIVSLSLSASARDVVLPAGTLLQCTLN